MDQTQRLDVGAELGFSRPSECCRNESGKDQRIHVNMQEA